MKHRRPSSASYRRKLVCTENISPGLPLGRHKKDAAGSAAKMSALDNLNWSSIRVHYDERVDIHDQLLDLHRGGNIRQFARLALGISNVAGNYSADEHKLGPQVLSGNLNPEKRVFDLGGRFIQLTTARTVSQLIRDAGLRYLQIGVGSEMSCMVNPNVCWVANTRTIWTHLVIKHADDFDKANEELRLYRDADTSSEMAYQIWTHIHRELATSMTRIADEGVRLARSARVTPGPIKYIWADAIANRMYADYHE